MYQLVDFHFAFRLIMIFLLSGECSFNLRCANRLRNYLRDDFDVMKNMSDEIKNEMRQLYHES